MVFIVDRDTFPLGIGLLYMDNGFAGLEKLYDTDIGRRHLIALNQGFSSG